jgi:hypothetical protein
MSRVQVHADIRGDYVTPKYDVNLSNTCVECNAKGTELCRQSDEH